MQMSPPISSRSETNTLYTDTFSGFSVPPPPFISQPQQRCLKEITTESSTSRRLVLNEVQTNPSSSISPVLNEGKTLDISTNGKSLYFHLFSINNFE
jgi:hypothetical protein